MKQPKIVTLDIETSPLEVYAWGLWDQRTGVNQIQTEWSILSYSAKTLGEKKVRYQDAGGRGKGSVRDDSHLLDALWHELDDADIVVAQNGRRFDMRKINARLIMEGYLPYSPVKVIDTKVEAQRVAMFTSNRLEWLSIYLSETQKEKHKDFPGFELWLECLADNPKAWAAMKRYNRLDTISTEELYLRIRPWIVGHPNLAAYDTTGSVIACPKCGSHDIEEAGSWLTQVNEYPRFRCNECGGFSRGRFTVSSTERRKSLLVN
jgi:predicted RNA-binding Zn-ribbon protein involved in translation (DUF1610 family)